MFTNRVSALGSGKTLEAENKPENLFLVLKNSNINKNKPRKLRGKEKEIEKKW